MNASVIIVAGIISAAVCAMRTIADARAHITRIPSVILSYAISTILLLAILCVTSALLAYENSAWSLLGQTLAVASIAGIASTFICCIIDMIRRLNVKIAKHDTRAKRVLTQQMRIAEHDCALEEIVRVYLAREANPTIAAVAAVADQLQAASNYLPDDTTEKPLVAASAREAQLLAEVARRVNRLPDEVTHDPARLTDVIMNVVADINLLSS